MYGSTRRSMLIVALLSLMNTPLLICLKRSSWRIFRTRGLTPLILWEEYTQSNNSAQMTSALIFTPLFWRQRPTWTHQGCRSSWPSWPRASAESHPSPFDGTPSHTAQHAWKCPFAYLCEAGGIKTIMNTIIIILKKSPLHVGYTNSIWCPTQGYNTPYISLWAIASKSKLLQPSMRTLPLQ